MVMNDPLARIHEGMHVVDSAGQEVGRVAMIQMGDPEAATTAGNEDRDTGPLQKLAEAFGGHREPDVHEPLRSKLVRTGFVKIDSPNLMAGDRYVPTDYVRDVSEDRVELSVRRGQVVTEDGEQ
jgi:hypothetical protein